MEARSGPPRSAASHRLRLPLGCDEGSPEPMSGKPQGEIMGRPRINGVSSCRQLKCICGDCAYTVRVARSWLDSDGPPLCPRCVAPMESPDYDISPEYRAHVEAEGPSILSDKWIQRTRTDHVCARCGGTIVAGDTARAVTLAGGGESPATSYTCFLCTSQGSSRTAGGYA